MTLTEGRYVREDDWDDCDDFRKMFYFVMECRPRISDRKVALWAVACGRGVVAGHKKESALRELYRFLEEFIDGRIPLSWANLAWNVLAKDLGAEKEGDDVVDAATAILDHYGANADVSVAAWQASRLACRAADRLRCGRGSGIAQEAEQLQNLRDVVGPLCFLDVAVRPLWRQRNDRAAEKIAKRIYEDREWSLLPILADALEDAGCDDPALVSHCRSPEPHALGCWAVDLILGKS